MRVAVYDKNPGPGVNQWFLALSWRIGCFLHKLFGKLDAYHAATSWDDAFEWLLKQDSQLTSVQYWGHGGAGNVWLAGKYVERSAFKKLAGKIAPSGVLWFRTCNTFRGLAGYTFSKSLSETLGCTIAGHTRTIGVFQSGLHTLKPGEEPRWSIDEKDEGPPLLSQSGLQLGNNTIFCLRATIPEGW
jgi:hypothetical protein